MSPSSELPSATTSARRAGWIANVLLAGATLLVAAGAGECAMRLAFPRPPRWVEPQTKHLESPLLGWVLPPGTRSYTIDAPVSVNALGLRDDEIPRAKPPGERRVLALGDSFTFALGVRFEDLYVQQLERLLAADGGSPVQVVNAGVAGYNTRQELIYLLADGLSLGPDLVTVGFYWNDLVGNEPALPDLARTARVADAASLYESGEREQRHLIPGALRDRLRSSVLLYQVVIRSKMVLALLRPPTDPYFLVQKALLEGDAAYLEPFWRTTGGRLLEIAEACRARGVPVVLLVFPDENWVRRDWPSLAYGERLREIWAPTGMSFVDLTSAYRDALEAGVNPFLDYDQHPNASGMRIAAEALHRVIVEQRLLAARSGQGQGAP
jgi:lysophospholipase L1-like esterase